MLQGSSPIWRWPGEGLKDGPHRVPCIGNFHTSNEHLERNVRVMFHEVLVGWLMGISEVVLLLPTVYECNRAIFNPNNEIREAQWIWHVSCFRADKM